MQNIISLIFRYFLSLFPACAGVIPLLGSSVWRSTTFPRMCGGDPRFHNLTDTKKSFSPHVRG